MQSYEIRTETALKVLSVCVISILLYAGDRDTSILKKYSRNRAFETKYYWWILCVRNCFNL